MNSQRLFISMIFGSLLVGSLFLSLSCADHPSSTNPTPFEITVSDVSCIDAVFMVSPTSAGMGESISISRNGVSLRAMKIATDSMIFTDTLLVPDTDYEYSFSSGDWSQRITIRTKDTTSHAWQWDLKVMTSPLPGYLRGAKIINDTSVYAVGRFYTAGDSLHFILHWDGHDWKPIDYTITYKGVVFTPDITSVTGISNSDVWYASFFPIHFNQDSWALFDVNSNIVGFGSSTNCALTASDSSTIFGCTGGKVLENMIGKWTMVQTPTSMNITSLSQARDGNIYAVARNSSTDEWDLLIGKKGEYKIFETATEPDLWTKGTIRDSWASETNTIYVVGNYLRQYRAGKWEYTPSLVGNFNNPNYQYRAFLQSISGNAFNDIIIAGERNTVRHFNGSTWEQLGMPYDPTNSDIYWLDSDMKGNFAVIAGSVNGQAAVMMFHRK